jgi:hypothetical protein
MGRAPTGKKNMIIPNVLLEALLTVRDEEHPDGYKVRLPVVALTSDMNPYVAVSEGLASRVGSGIRIASEIGEINSVHPEEKLPKVVQFLPLAVEALAVWEVVDGLFRSEPIVGQFLREDGDTEPAVIAHDGTFVSAYMTGADAIVQMCTGHASTVESELFDGRKIKVSTGGDGSEPTVTLL